MITIETPKFTFKPNGDTVFATGLTKERRRCLCIYTSTASLTPGAKISKAEFLATVADPNNPEVIFEFQSVDAVSGLLNALKTLKKAMKKDKVK
jgi:hypothetical protein